MFAFITMNIDLVPLIEGLRAQIYELRFEIIGGLRSQLLFFFFGRKNIFKGKSSQSKISSCLWAYTYKCVLCTHIRIYVCRDLVHLDSSGPPGVSSRLLGSHPSTPSVKCMFTSCAFFQVFREKQIVKEKKQLVQKLIPPPSIYINRCTLKYTYNPAKRWSTIGICTGSRPRRIARVSHWIAGWAPHQRAWLVNAGATTQPRRYHGLVWILMVSWAERWATTCSVSREILTTRL